MEAANQASAPAQEHASGRAPVPAHWRLLLRQAKSAVADGRLGDALERCRDALQIAKAHAGKTEWLAESYIRLADMCAALDQPDAARRLYGQGIAVLDGLPDGVTAMLAHAVSNMGRLHLLNGETAKAVELATAGDALQRRLKAPDSPAIKLNLALVAATAGREDDADLAFREALAAADRRRGAIGALAFAVHDNFAWFSIQHDRLDEAEMALRSCLILRQETGGPRHPAYADGLLNLARLHLLSDAGEEAATLLWQATDVCRRSGDRPNATHIEAVYLLARCTVQSDRARDVERLRDRLLGFARADARAAAAAEAAALHIGALLCREGRDGLATEASLRRALTLADRLSGGFRRLGDDISGSVLRELSELLTESGKGAEAERLRARAAELGKQPQWSVTGFVFVAA